MFRHRSKVGMAFSDNVIEHTLEAIVSDYIFAVKNSIQERECIVAGWMRTVGGNNVFSILHVAKIGARVS